MLQHSALHESTANLRQPEKVIHRSLDLRPLVASYFAGRFLTAARFRTSVGDMSIRRGRGCSWAMCMERRLVATRSPQNLQRALPGEMWTRCIPNSMSGSLFARQAQSSSWVLVGKWLLKRASRSKVTAGLIVTIILVAQQRPVMITRRGSKRPASSSGDCRKGA